MYIQELWRYPVKSLGRRDPRAGDSPLARQGNCCSGAGTVPADDFSTQRRAGGVWCSNST
jgi:hypothetical protein